ncbi:NAD(P)/FAD-dependent oxidoreductase [Wenjunlia vitaminophila]|nr:tryptophan 7-halogenase [Wenjunlia vitaminophila]
MKHRENSYDVIVLGTGLAGSIMGAILARAGKKVLLIDSSSHPRFAIGESTVGYTLVHLRMLAHRYGVPEIGNMGSLGETTKFIGNSSGLKRHFGFMIHRDGQYPDPYECNQFRLPKVLHQAVHYYRQDTDAYLFSVAIKYGCHAKQNYRVVDIDLGEDEVVVHGEDGTSYQARFLVDGSGYRSPVAQKLELREEPTPLKHHARSIFTHMIGVEPLDRHINASRRDTPPLPWHTGTMHHMFERGWFWIIPFNNHKRSASNLCSVGVQLDPRRYPKQEDMTAEEEFWAHVKRFPLVHQQLFRARSVREFVRTDRLQYSSKQSVGHRWAMLSHAAGFVDPLFSRGMSNTAEIINSLAWRLLEALDEDDFSVDRFKYVDVLEQNLIDYNDKLVNSAFITWPNYDLWQTVYRIWSFGSLPGAFRIIHSDLKARRSGDDGYYRRLEEAPYPGLWWPDNDGFKQTFDDMVRSIEAVESGEMSVDAATRRLYGHLQDADWIPPSLGVADPATRFINPNPQRLIRMVGWSARKAPPFMREYMVGTSKETVRHFVTGRKIF